jgi:phage terminase large subunit-like protein
LWKRQLVEEPRVEKGPALRRIVIGVDPAVGSTGENVPETGIVTAGVGAASEIYVLSDDSLRLPRLARSYSFPVDAERRGLASVRHRELEASHAAHDG